ncbi:ANTAR domain-containing protein [Rhodococcus sp. D2-41]|uniref:ANTAR domain-containing protein n=1 Tax=Speluncibacter jeojiensis TaxID=2710754 RepID=UPI0024103B9B|nr:ANTAR domain-containing protein [Rhodococcus sp. D2-41]MDG3010773.1 ANTAR domain-containing protein [Rhodococcus sp. D2-41]
MTNLPAQVRGRAAHAVAPESRRTRATLDMAKGIVVAATGCDPDQAFAKLVEVAKRNRIAVLTVARALIDAATGSECAENAAGRRAVRREWGDVLGGLASGRGTSSPG